MRQPRRRRRVTPLSVVAAAAVLAGAGAASADAATVTVTGDDGQPVGLSPTAPPTIRNMAPQVGVTLPPGSGRYSVAVTDPANALAADAARCQDPAVATNVGVPYRGNGAYTVTVTNFGLGDTACVTPVGAPEVYRFTVAGAVTLQRRSPFVIREPDSAARLPLALPIDLNPGAATTEVRFAKDASIRRDGAIRGRSGTGRVDTTSGTAVLTFRTPGVYTVVARAERDGAATPWSRPVRIRAMAPFDLGRVRFTDTTGPSFRIEGRVRDRNASGRVSVAIGIGPSGPFQPIGGSSRIGRDGRFFANFRARAAGVYRLRFTYAGNRLVARGVYVRRFRVQTVIVGA